MSTTPQTLQIFSIISKIENFVNECPKPKIGGLNKRIVDLDIILDLLGDLKVTIPEDIRRANSVLVDADTTITHAEENSKEMLENAQKQSETILNDANSSAADIIAEAQRKYEELVSEDSVLTEAQRRAELLALKAEHNAHIVYDGAKQYADDILIDLQRFIAEYQRLIEINRNELGVRFRPQQPVEPAAAYQSVRQPPVAQQKQTDVRAAAQTMPVQQEDEEEYYIDEEPPAKKGSWWNRLSKNRDSDLFDDEFDLQDEYEPDTIPTPRKRRQRSEKNIDINE